jgi:uncharacterized membrane protein YhaH (DUF805 family)
MSGYLEVLKKYAVFDGRAGRKEYWYFNVFSFFIIIVLSVIDMMTGTFNVTVGLGLLGGLYTLAVLIPGIAVSVRRLHDTDRSGLWLLINAIPIIGMLVFLVFTAQNSTPGDNQYGSNPTGATE